MSFFYFKNNIILKIKNNGDFIDEISFCGEYDNADEKSFEKAPPVIKEAVRWLDIYFSKREPNFVPKLRLSGTDFQIRVWKRLCEIPYGETISYEKIANELFTESSKTKMSPRAIGGAVRKNPIAIIIPCHRVIGKNGDLTGFSGGLEIKKRLLELEKKK